ncbi:MAG: Re/Si-specific NAD(P)(+) transhydrogenase subunit alpha [Gammaproteobacteria bacterium]|nr:Re/Si-specific NAD(P)(+) transhydrogenase subunit alpha [Gammaproteobacteria bacterium]
MKIGVPKEIAVGETRVGATPETIKKLHAAGFSVVVETGAGSGAHFTDQAYRQAGAEVVNTSRAFAADIIFKVHKPSFNEIARMQRGAVLISLLDMCHDDGTFDALAEQQVQAFAMEMMPRLSRAQTMDVLSSQANIAGYRAVLEASRLYGRFFPMMMTSAGSAKPARVVVLGAGVAGLQAIATARRLGAQVWSYDVRPEVKEQVQSLGAKFIEFDLGESGAGSGGYAKQLSPEARAKQQQMLQEELKRADVIISTALIPCMPAPVLITEAAVQGMHEGAVIIDMAAATGGNCPLTEPDKTVIKHDVILCGITNFPALMPSDASNFFARNLYNFLMLMLEKNNAQWQFKDFFADEITNMTLITHQGKVRFETTKMAKKKAG